jgi:P27 family predicted phage terminase small subunit
MGLRGPAPKPAKSLRLAGSELASARERAEPPSDEVLPECPAWLDEVGRAAWADWLPRIAAMKIMSSGDRDALALMCDTWSRYLAAREKVVKLGEVIPLKNKDGSLRLLKRNPYSAILAEHGERLRRMLSEFGLSPVGRARIGAAKEQAPDEQVQDIFSRRRPGA